LIGNVERQMAVLLDQNDRLPFVLQAPDGAADLRDDQRRSPSDGFIEQQYRGLPISARPIASICLFFRRRVCGELRVAFA